jgi:hypothetical protein
MRFETINLGVPGPPGPASIVPGRVGPEGPQGIPGPPGGESGSVNGMAALREIEPVSGQTLPLNYHTTPGDLGAGEFYGVTTGGLYTDNDGTVIVPTGGNGSAAWLRVWDNVRAHVGWFGARCDPQGSVDDYIPATRALALFTDGRFATRSGVLDIGPGFAFSQPLHYGGELGRNITIQGYQANGRGGNEPSLLKYTGPLTDCAIMFYGANESTLQDVNIIPGNALNGVIVTADNTYNHTSVNAIAAGINVVVTPSGATAADKILWLMQGAYLGIDAGGPNFEVVRVITFDAVAGTFVADFTKSHAAGAQIGGGHPSSGMRINRASLLSPASPIYTKLSIPHTDGPGGGSERIFTPVSMANIKVGYPLWIGHGAIAEVVMVKSITATTFTADANQLHPINCRIMYATSSILFGNRLLATVQVSEVAMEDISVQGSAYVDVGGGVPEITSYCGIRQNRGGNVKNFTVHHFEYLALKVAWSSEDSSGQYLVSGAVGGQIEDTIFAMSDAEMTVISLEDESAAAWLRAGAGSSSFSCTFIGCTFQGMCSKQELDAAGAQTFTDQMVVMGGTLTMIGCSLSNSRTVTSLPVLVIGNVRAVENYVPSSVALIGCQVRQATPLRANGLPQPFIIDTPLPAGGGVDVIADGGGRVTMLNCSGGLGAPNICHFPVMLPRTQGKATYDPVSLAAGAAGTIQTMALIGAAPGDHIAARCSTARLGEHPGHREIPVHQSNRRRD